MMTRFWLVGRGALLHRTTDAYAAGTYSGGGYTVEGPFVPCDDAAIEKAEIALISAPYDWRQYSPAIVAQIVLMGAAGKTDDEIAEFVLRAAGETP